MKITEVQVAKLNLKEDDILLFTFPEETSEEQLRRFARSFRENAPFKVTAMLVSGNVKVSVISGVKDGRENQESVE